MTEQAPSASWSWGRLLAAVGSPIALVTALLFYFGWVRTRFQARTLGFDPAILNLSLQDYLLKSINVLFLPMVLLVLAVLIFDQGHRRLVAAADRNPRLHRAAIRFGRLLILSWPAWAVAGVVLFAVPATQLVAIPTCLTAGVVLALYGHALTRRLGATTRWTAMTTALVYALLAFALFWDIERVARSTGEAFARDILALPQQLVPVTVFSQKPLEIASADIDEIALRKDSAYPFCYSGLRLLEGGDDRFLLMSDGGTVFLLRTTDSMRFEFGRGAGC